MDEDEEEEGKEEEQEDEEEDEVDLDNHDDDDGDVDDAQFVRSKTFCPSGLMQRDRTPIPCTGLGLLEKKAGG